MAFASSDYFKRKLGVTASQLPKVQRQLLLYFIETYANEFSKDELLKLWEADNLEYSFGYQNQRGSKKVGGGFNTSTFIEVYMHDKNSKYPNYFDFGENLETIKEVVAQIKKEQCDLLERLENETNINQELLKAVAEALRERDELKLNLKRVREREQQVFESVKQQLDMLAQKNNQN